MVYEVEDWKGFLSELRAHTAVILVPPPVTDPEFRGKITEEITIRKETIKKFRIKMVEKLEDVTGIIVPRGREIELIRETKGDREAECEGKSLPNVFVYTCRVVKETPKYSDVYAKMDVFRVDKELVDKLLEMGIIEEV